MMKFVSILLALLLVCLTVSSMAEQPFAVAEPNPEALEADYAGDWLCAYAGHGKDVFEAESHLSDLGMESLMTIHIENGLVSFTGMPEMGTDPFPFRYADGAMVFEPEEGLVIFTLQLLRDGTLSMKFNMVEAAAVLYLFRVEAQ
ncbi:MAG: hypothetical protein IJP78_10945 [Clostridia bacterium]|nr:hypothetical protein [Clostridia bacterium]